MKKRLLLILIILASSLSTASASSARLARLTVVNKSGRKIEISLTGKNSGQFYYLRIPQGDRQSPAEKTFTLVPDVYSSSLYYVELWDPVYGYECGSQGQSLDVTRNVRLMVFECDRRPPNAGEPPSIVKYGGRAGVKFASKADKTICQRSDVSFVDFGCNE